MCSDATAVLDICHPRNRHQHSPSGTFFIKGYRIAFSRLSHTQVNCQSPCLRNCSQLCVTGKSSDWLLATCRRRKTLSHRYWCQEKEELSQCGYACGEDTSCRVLHRNTVTQWISISNRTLQTSVSPLTTLTRYECVNISISNITLCACQYGGHSDTVVKILPVKM